MNTKKKIYICLIAIMIFIVSIQYAFAQSIPKFNEELSNAQVIRASMDHILALKSDGSILAWGLNKYGQLGLGNNIDSSVPKEIPGFYSIVAIEVGSEHSLALKSDGDLYSWGNNNCGQLGIGDNNVRSSPEKITDLYAVASMAAGQKHSIALKSDGTVWTWGDNTYGQLGDGTTLSKSSPIQITNLHSIVAVAAGTNHSMALQGDGTLWVWGDNSKGQIGDGTTTKVTSPKIVKVIDLGVITTIAAGANQSYALTALGDLYSWGDNTYGQLGDGTTVTRRSPVQVKNLPVISTSYQKATIQSGIAVGANHVLAVTPMGDIYAWGRNDEGQLGDGTTTQRSTPVLVQEISACSNISAGGNRSFAARLNTDFYSWGEEVKGTFSKVNGQDKGYSETKVGSIINVKINGKTVEFTAKPRLINGRAVVPIRDIIEGFGGKVDWNSSSSTISGAKNGNIILLKVGSDKVTANGKEVKMDTPVAIIENRAYGQVRTISEALGATIEWDASTNTVSISIK